MNKEDFKFKLGELYRLVHLLKMQEGVNNYTPLFDELDAAENHLVKAMSHIDQYESE